MHTWIRGFALTCALCACNSGGSDPVSACTNYCEHTASCEGIGGSTIDNACKQSCADAGAITATACGDGGAAAVTNVYNCLANLPCSDFGIDAGVAPIMGCVQQAGCQ